MKIPIILIWIGYILAIISIIVGIIEANTGFINLGPDSYFRIVVVCLLFVISLSLVQIAFGKKGTE